MSREKAIRMAGRHWLAQRHFLLFTGRKLLFTQGRNCNGNCLYACCNNMLLAVKLTGIDLARLWVTGFSCIQGEWLLKQGVYGDPLTQQGKTVLSTGNIFAVWPVALERTFTAFSKKKEWFLVGITNNSFYVKVYVSNIGRRETWWPY